MDKLIAKRAQLWEQMQALQNRSTEEDRPLTAEEREQWDRMEADMRGISEDIERFERSARLEAVEQVGDGTDRGAERETGESRADYDRAFERFVRYGLNRLTPEEQRLMEDGFSAPENRAQAAGVDAAGGYTVPETMLNKITDSMKAFGGLASLVGGFTTDSGNPLNWPTSDETAAEGEILGENTQSTEDDIEFGTNTLGAYTYSSKIVRVSLQLIQDSGINIESFVGGKLGQRLGRITARHIANGTGTGQPQGVMQAAAGVTGAVSASAVVTYDNLIDLEHSVDPAYRANAQYALHDDAVALFRKVKDGQNRPLWQPSLQAGVASTINGRAYTVDNNIPAPAPGAKSIAFGDFQAGYVLRRVNGGQLLRLSERYADFLQVGFISFLRLDGKLDDTAAIRTYQHGAAA